MTEHPVSSLCSSVYNQLINEPVWRAVADRDAIVTSTLAIQQIPAPTFAEQRRARHVQQAMRSLDLNDVRIDDVYNVYGCIPGRQRGPGVLITAHTDTVFAEHTDLTVRRDGDRIYGPGISDNSVSVAALLHLARVLQQHHVQPERTLWFVANTGEEGLGDLRGMRAAVDALQNEIAAVIVLDAAFGSVVHAGVASRRFRISAQAAGGHSWQDFGAPSAVHVLVRLAAQLTELSVSDDPKTTFNIGVIEGGTSVNAIAQRAHLLLDLRSVSETSLQALVAQVESIVDNFCQHHSNVTLHTEVVGNRPGGGIAQDHPLVALAEAAYAAVGATTTFEVASTDANVPLSRGIPAVCVGMSRGGNAHRLDEYLETGDIPSGMQAMLLLTLAAARQAQEA